VKFNRKIRLNRIASVTKPARIGSIVEVSPECEAEEGAFIVCRALSDNPNYGMLELPSGRLAKVVAGNLLVGTLGARQALHGYMGRVPDQIKVGDTISLLNMGGVMGVCDEPNPDLGLPIQLEVLGQVMRDGQRLNLKDFSIPKCETLGPGAPIVMIVGTCMNSGKTFAAAEIIRVLTQAGVKIAAGKVSGVAAMRDLLTMMDNGAITMRSFVDCGLPSTVNATDLGGVTRAVVQELDNSSPDVILLELGDGIIGGYNTQAVLDDAQVRDRTKCRVLCANDLVGAWGGVTYLEKTGHSPDIMSGPVTDNAVGTTYIKRELKMIAANARTHPTLLAQSIADALGLDVKLEQ
jgi:hypothetical protein